MVGDVEAIYKTIAALKKIGMVLKNVDGLQDSLSCEVRFSRDKKIAWVE